MGTSSVAGQPAPAAPDLGTTAVGGKAEASGDRQIVKTGSMSITVTSPADAADDASRIVESAGGRIDGRSERAGEGGSGGSAQLTVRIPSAKLTPTIDRLKKLGTVENVSVDSSDVTTRSQDLDARISALHTSVGRLQSLMAQATSTQDLITIESALSDRQADLESMEAEKRQLTDQVDLSSIRVLLDSPATARAHLPGNFLDGLVTGWNALTAFFAGLLVVVGVLLPWLVLSAAVAVAVIALVRMRRGPRRSAGARTPDAS